MQNDDLNDSLLNKKYDHVCSVCPCSARRAVWMIVFAAIRLPSDIRHLRDTY